MANSEQYHFTDSLLDTVACHGKDIGPLTTAEAQELLQKHGPNTIETKKKNPCYMIFLQALFHPFNVLLCIIAISSGMATSQEAEPEYSTALIISVMIFISTSLRFYQEWKSEGAVTGLLKLITKTVSVVRYDAVEPIAREMSIPSEELVPGDWIVLHPGEVVPADGVVLSSKVFFISQAPLTGEAIPVEKYSLRQNQSSRGSLKEVVSDIKNSNNNDVEKPKPTHKSISKTRRFFMVIFGMRVSAESQLDQNGHLLTEDLSSAEHVFMGSQVITGVATVRILRTGHEALLGKMAEALSKAQPVNAFQQGVKRISWIFFLTMAVMVPPIFLIRGFTSANDDRWMTALLFALSVAVGLTPEMLPMIVNANLAKGSVALTKKNSIVKRLDAIINLGAVDIICTDKTGTLTKSVVQLSSHIDPYGNVSNIPLEVAFLNSYFQSVLQNPLDSAIISFYDRVVSPVTGIPVSEESDLLSVKRKKYIEADATAFAARFSRLDELPFDFVRRRLSVILQDNEQKVYLACKGAVEEILEVCIRSIKDFGKPDPDVEIFPPENFTVPLDDTIRQQILSINTDHSNRGERVLAVAYKLLPANTTGASTSDEQDMIFAGFLCFVDPPKDSAKQAIADLQKHNIEIKVLTGDAPNICASVCNKLNLPVKAMLTGYDIQLAAENGNLSEVVEQGTIFAKLTPLQKALVVQTLCNMNHVVGFIGDGINDAPALKEADIGISVENGVDICRESANIILLDKDLNVVVDGIRIGRKTYGNTIKYIAMAVSSNFGNVFSVLVAACWLPYEPMTSLQILTQNLLYDISQIAIPWDSVDEEFLYVPHHWKMKSIVRFMVVIGPWSSIFDVGTFAYMYFHHNIKTNAKPEEVRKFQTAWFTVGLLTQTLIVHIIRTPKIPFFQSRASLPLTLLTLTIMGIGLALPFVPQLNDKLELSNNGLPDDVYIFLGIVLISYCTVASIAKIIYVKIFKEWF